MDDTEKIPSSTFGAPFDDADADLTLRSSDLVDFHVYKNAIFKASASLKNTVQDTSESPGLESTTSTVSARPILALPEPSRVLRTLLSLICHVPIDLPDSFQDMAAALAAARKYEMEASVSILSKLVRGGSDQPWSMGSVDPFKAYFISCRFGLKEEAMRAARLTLPKDAKMERLVGSELLCVSGPELYALWRYRDDASNAVRACVKQFCTASQYQRLWMPDDSASLARCKDSARDQLPVWLRRHLLKAAEHPTCIDMATFYQAFSKHAWGTNCSWCQEIPPDKVQRVWTELEKIVIEAADKINVPFDSMGKDPGAQPNAPRTTPNPAFARPDADVILRSSDNVDFGVYKATLAMASPVFESMFSLPNPSGSQEATVQVCQMTEGSKTLNTLLSMIFPVNVIIPTTIEDVFSVRSAAQKFDMDSVLHLLRIILKSEDDLVTAKNAFRAYGLGYEYKLRNEAIQAARRTLELPMTFNEIGHDLNSLSGRAVCALWRFRVACLKSASDCFQRASDPASSWYAKHKPSEGCSETIPRGTSMPFWWSSFFQNMAARTRDAAQPPSKHDTLCDDFRSAIPKSHTDGPLQDNSIQRHMYLHTGMRGGCICCLGIKTQRVDEICTSLKDMIKLETSKIQFVFDD